MQKFVSRRLSRKTLPLLLLFTILAAFAFSDLARTSAIFNPRHLFTVVLDPGHGGYTVRRTRIWRGFLPYIRANTAKEASPYAKSFCFMAHPTELSVGCSGNGSALFCPRGIHTPPHKLMITEGKS